MLKKTEEISPLRKKCQPWSRAKSKSSNEEEEQWLSMEEDENKTPSKNTSVVIVDMVAEE